MSKQLSLREAIELLAQQDFRITTDDDEYSYSYRLEGPSFGVSHLIPDLIRQGWLVSSANGGAYYLSDEGRKAFLKSTDELGDGQLIPPKAAL